MENHSVDIPWWDSLVDGIPKPILNKGYVRVPEGPGLGITLNEEAIKQHLQLTRATSIPRRSGITSGPATRSGRS